MKALRIALARGRAEAEAAAQQRGAIGIEREHEDPRTDQRIRRLTTFHAREVLTVDAQSPLGEALRRRKWRGTHPHLVNWRLQEKHLRSATSRRGRPTEVPCLAAVPKERLELGSTDEPHLDAASLQRIHHVVLPRKPRKRRGLAPDAIGHRELE